MIESIIRWSIGNRFFVILATLILIGGGLFSIKNNLLKQTYRVSFERAIIWI